MLFQLRDDSVLFSADQSFRMRPVAQVKSSHPGLVRIHGLLTTGRGGLEISVVEIVHNDILVMKVHGSRDAWGPGVVPDNDAGILEKFLAARPGKRRRITRRVGKRVDLEILEADQNAWAVVLVRCAFGQEFRMARA